DEQWHARVPASRHTIEQEFGAQHRQVCGNANANADVESFHAHEEPEFFDIETFASRKEFWEKITTYQHYWNLGRPNSYKGDRTPLQILQEANARLPPEVLLLAPLDLDTLTLAAVGHDVPVLPAGARDSAVRYPRRNRAAPTARTKPMAPTRSQVV